MKIKAGIMGVTGYTGGELIRLLLNHPQVEIRKAASRSNAGNDVSMAHPHLMGIIPLIEEGMDVENFIDGLDVVFLALPHGKSAPIVKEANAAGVKVIDLGADFRLKSVDEYREWYEVEHESPELISKSVYGLSEIYKEEIINSSIIANPGCYPTSIILGLAPLLKKKLIDPETIVIDSKSGISGAGKTLTQQTHFPDMNDNFLAYKVGCHRHTPEIEQELSLLAELNIKISFTPHLVPMNRGILSTIYGRATVPLSNKELGVLYEEYYQGRTFIRIREKDNLPQTKWVYGSNFCDIAPVYDGRTGRIIIVSAIDNLVKGASGQAIQNMNLMFGLDETTGLMTAPVYP
ncbi:MAG: N-acetyl-gamma-glutamyl-phosphate reductase [Bacillota bacterium]